MSYPVAAVIGDEEVHLGAPLVAPASAGAVAQAVTTFLRAIEVFDKTGLRIGYITRYSVSAAPSKLIGRVGSFEFYVPRTSPELALIKQDRLVRVTTLNGLAPWAGVMAPKQSSGGAITVTCPDLFDLMRDIPIEADEEPEVDLAATAYYKLVIQKMNDERIKYGEVKWAFDPGTSVKRRGATSSTRAIRSVH